MWTATRDTVTLITKEAVERELAARVTFARCLTKKAVAERCGLWNGHLPHIESAAHANVELPTLRRRRLGTCRARGLSRSVLSVRRRVIASPRAGSWSRGTS